ncbi:MAG: two-component system, OmpR family, phosphate regulon sensor histidine kinase PhoR, partial [Actinomycetota bacterium]|nr:two-component system, OmpR family, phosphate regulon sensor histidine kinase PhoR [Actinomycetota bacterium]
MSERCRHRAAQGGTIAASLRKLVFLCWAMLLVVSFTAVGSLAAHSDNIRRLTLIDGPAVDANNQVRQAMVDAQTGLYGYQMSGDRILLQPYLGARSRTMAALVILQDKLAMAAAKGGDGPRNEALGKGQRQAAELWWANAILTERTLTSGGRASLAQNRALFDRFSAQSSVLGEYLMAEHDQTRVAARALSSRGEMLSIAATFLTLLAMLFLGGRVARAISRPLTELRDTMTRQRGGEPGARAREDQGSVELRSVAADFNLLTEQNMALLEIQASDLRLNTLTFEVARAIRATSDTQGVLEVLCARLGAGLGVERVIANAYDGEDTPQLLAQWHLPDLPPLADFSEALSAELAALADELFCTTGFRARNDFLETEVPSQERGRALYEETGARAVIMAPIGFGDRVVGIIYVVMVREPRVWTESETTVVQQVAGFVARAIIEAGHQSRQREYVDRVEKLDRQKSNFLATVSHELRTPLTSISGYLEVLQDLDAGPLNSQQNRMLEVISRNTFRLRSLIEDVLVISR